MLETVIKELDLSGIVVYGTLNGELFDGLRRKTKFYYYDSWSTRRRKKMNNNGAKRASNRYGNNRSSKCRCRPTEHIKYAWARDFNEITLLQHLSDHRKSFGSTTKKNTVSMLLSLQI